MNTDRTDRRHWLLAAGGLILGIGIGLAVFVDFRRPPPASPEVQSSAPPDPEGGLLTPGGEAPAFVLNEASGGAVSLEDQRGKVVLVNFWATWCAPCEVEMPVLQQAYEAHRERGFTVLAVDFDEPAGDVQAFGDKLGLTFRLLLDPGGEVQQLYRVRGYPTSVFVDSHGVIRVYHIGVMTEGQLEGYLAEMGFGSP